MPRIRTLIVVALAALLGTPAAAMAAGKTFSVTVPRDTTARLTVRW